MVRGNCSVDRDMVSMLTSTKDESPGLERCFSGMLVERTGDSKVVDVETALCRIGGGK